jgi:hypothetical protein
MAQRLFAVVTVLGIVVAVASPTSSKGINHAHFSGPGLPSSGVMIVPGEYHRLELTGLIGPKKKGLSTLGLSRRDLGLVYRAQYRMDYAPDVMLRQLIYPYAATGPITFTPRGQHIGRDYETFRGGWYSAPPELLRFLVSKGSRTAIRRTATNHSFTPT